VGYPKNIEQNIIHVKIQRMKGLKVKLDLGKEPETLNNVHLILKITMRNSMKKMRHVEGKTTCENILFINKDYK